MIKKTISTFLIIILLLFSFTSCNIKSEEEKLNSEIELFVTEEYNNLMAASVSFKTIENYDNYLLKWAEKNNIRASYDKNKNIIMSKSPSDGYGTENSLNIQTPINLVDIKENGMAVSIALYLISSVTENNFMRVIFTNNINDDFYGANNLSSRYSDIENHINLDWSSFNNTEFDDIYIVDGGAGISTQEFSSNINYTSANYPHAYELSISGLNSENSGDINAKRVNPIKLFGDLMASLKSNGILFELASFNGGVSADTYPDSASITIIVNDNDVKKIVKKVESSQNKFKNTYEDIYPSYVYTMTEVEKPNLVLDKKTTDSIVSVLYTLVDGTFLRDEETGEVTCISNIGYISTDSDRLRILFTERSLDSNSYNNGFETFEIIAALSEVDHKLISKESIWERNEENYLLDTVINLSEENYGINTRVERLFTKSEAAVFSQRENTNNLISIKINKNNYIPLTNILIDLLKNQKPVV